MNVKTKKDSLFLLIFGFFMVSCNKPSDLKMMKIGGETQGTYYAITCFSKDSIELQPAIDSLLRRFDSTASTYKPNSIISRFNDNDSTVRADEMYEIIFNKAMEVSRITDGAFDITVGPLVYAWGFGLSNRLKMDQHKVDSLLPLVGYKKVKLVNGKLVKPDSRMRIDYNAIAQGYAVDVIGDFLQSKGIENFLIDIGGEVLARGTKPDGEKWSVAIEMPTQNADDERSIQALVSLTDRAISTSGSYRKFYEENGIRYSHTINPADGYPVKHTLLSVSVLAENCMTADAYATALMVMGVEKAKIFLEKHTYLEAYFISSMPDGEFKIDYTPGFEEVFRKDK